MRRSIDATGDRENLVLGSAAAALGVVGVGGVWVCEHLGAVLTGRPQPTSDPLRLVVAVARGRQAWGTAEWLVAGGLAAALLVLVVVVILLWPKRGRRMRPDLSARHMGRGRDVAHLTAAGSARTARRLVADGPGLPIGQTIGFGTAGRRMLHSSWEDMLILIA